MGSVGQFNHQSTNCNLLLRPGPSLTPEQDSTPTQNFDPESITRPSDALLNDKEYISISSYDFEHDTNSFIPVGCLRVDRQECEIELLVWRSWKQWQPLGNNQNIRPRANSPFLSTRLQNAIFRSIHLSPVRNLYQAGWIQLEFKARHDEWGQLRVWVLPDDVGNSTVDRSDGTLRRSLRNLLAQVDLSEDAWASSWSMPAPITTIQDQLDFAEEQVRISLFDLYNTLPSPTPDPGAVQDPGARYAMEDILKGKVQDLNTKMLPYQMRSAAMMLQRESEPALVPDPRLRPLLDRSGQIWYVDLHTGTCMRNSRMYETARGGICAENMGYGKTLICLALILATKNYSSQIPPEYSVGTTPVRSHVGSLLDMAAAAIGRTGTPWKACFSELLLKEEEDYVKCIDAIRKGIGFYYIPEPTPRRTTRNPISKPPRKVYLTTATLVVVPSNLVHQWEDEIKKHTTGLKVLVMNKMEDVLLPVLELTEFDIILFSKSRFEQEARDGTNAQGRRATDARAICRGMCPVESRTGRINCSCFNSDQIYQSPLRELHFKRLITDEGHNMGNSAKSNAVVVVDFLQTSSRWIVSGTPTPSLYGADKTPELPVKETNSGILLKSLDTNNDKESNDSWEEETGTGPKERILKQSSRAALERKDLEKLGNIAIKYLKARPWANSYDDNDVAPWSQYILHPRYNVKGHGNAAVLRDTLAGMMIRHRKEDIMKDVTLPPLHEKIVYIEGSTQDKLSLNLFAFVVNSNAVTSERKDADYLFHPRQRKALSRLVANLRQASFYWSGFTKQDVEFTMTVAQKFLDNPSVLSSDDDKKLLVQGILTATTALSSSVWCSASRYHEMPMYIENEFDGEAQDVLALDGIARNPTLLGANQILALQKFVNARRKSPSDKSMYGLLEAGRLPLEIAKNSSAQARTSGSKVSKIEKRLGENLPELAGGIKVSSEFSPRKKLKLALKDAQGKDRPSERFQLSSGGPQQSPTAGGGQANFDTQVSSIEEHGYPQSFQSVASDSIIAKRNAIPSIDINPELLDSVKLVSTGSAKLSYLLNEVVKYQQEEKIIIFYESDNVAYYIAQGLEALGIEHLIYAKTLTSDRRSRYLVTFNTSKQFRCLLMDVSQAAFGLDISSASRVYFVNPLLSKQVEAQAVKRAHRIGQFRPVHVETLVLRSSIEEIIVERREKMTNDEQSKCKTVLDDQTMYDWIKNVRFVALPLSDAPGPDQMACLESPYSIFDRVVAGEPEHPDLGLVEDRQTPRPKGYVKNARNVQTHRGAVRFSLNPEGNPNVGPNVDAGILRKT